MNFYKITSPEYGPDANYIRHNPVDMRDMPRLPYMYCPVCKRRYGYQRILMPELPAGCKEYFSEFKILDIAEWHQQKPEWARMLGISADDIIDPGAKLGPPLGTLTKNVQLAHIIHPPMMGLLWISQKARDAFVQAGLTGANFVKIDMEDKKGNKLPYVNYYEVDIYASCKRVNQYLESAIECELCGRDSFPHSQDLRVDLDTWDGYDFFRLDNNLCITMGSPRVKQVCDEYEFGNIIFIPHDYIDPEMEQWSAG